MLLSNSNRIPADAMASVLVDFAVAGVLVPWPCPSAFGHDDRYRLEELSSIGGSSWLYEATDTLLSSQGFDARVAIKIQRHKGAIPEAQAIRRVNHPHVVRVLDRGVTDDSHSYLVEEFVDGLTLDASTRPTDPRGIARFVAKVARGVQAIHSAGIVHCDLKPANIIVDAAGEPKIVDFGLAQSQASPEGVARGNLAFMSPEQFRGGDDALTPLADIYAVGGLLYYLLTGRLMNGDTREQVIPRLAAGDYVADPPEVPDDLVAIWRRAVAPLATERYTSASELAVDLDAWANHLPIGWLRPGAFRVTCLWIRRQPVVSALLMALVTGVLAMGVLLNLNWRASQRIVEQELDMVRQRAERDRQVQEQAMRLTTAEMESLRSKLRASVQGIAQIMFGKDNVAPTTSLVWLNWIYDEVLITPDGQLLSAEQMIEVLKPLARMAQGDGSDSIETLLAKVALAHILISRGDVAGAEPFVSDLEAGLLPRLDVHDPLYGTVRLMRRCLEAQRLLDAGADPAELREVLLSSLADDPVRATRDGLRLYAEFLGGLKSENETSE